MNIEACAKLNLYLDIIGKRADGYHELEMIFQEITLSDLITIEKAQTIHVICPNIAEEQNLAYLAAMLFQKQTGCGGATISIQKNIPSGAGLGGGSADAAAVLIGMNTLYPMLSKEALFQLADRIGKDVPFFLMGGCAKAFGTGEILTKIQNNIACNYLIIKPKNGVNTAEAYRLYDEETGEKPQKQTLSDCIRALKEGSAANFSLCAKNVLESVAIKLCPEVETILLHLKHTEGCVASFMTGSGSACVGMFLQEDLLWNGMEKLKRELGREYQFFVASNKQETVSKNE